MASDLSKYVGNAICMWLAGTNMPAAPASVYVALYNGDPKVTGTEVTADIRTAGRVAVDWDSISSGTDNSIVNEATVDFGNSVSATDVVVSHAALVDASTGGNILCSKAVTGGPLTITNGSLVQFPIGDLTFSAGS